MTIFFVGSKGASYGGRKNIDTQTTGGQNFKSKPQLARPAELNITGINKKRRRSRYDRYTQLELDWTGLRIRK